MAAELVADVHSFTGTGWQSGEAQLQVTAAVKAQGSQMPGGPAATLRDLVSKVPGTKAVYDGLMARRFEQYADTVENAVYHETNFILQPYAGPCVTTVHDLSHLRFPEFHPAHVVQFLEKSLLRTLQRADHVITVSSVVRDELLSHYNIPSERVSTIYEGVDAAYTPRDKSLTEEVLASYGLDHAGYVLLVATLEPRKGIDVLLQAWELLPKDLRRQFPLVLTGSSGWRNSQLLQQIERLSAEGSVRHLGYVPSDHLPLLFSGAAVFSYPSVYEGFGLPVLDAMSSAVPVVCRAGTSMAEFAQGSCLLCETGSAEELAHRLESLLQDESMRREWGERGRLQSQKFSWRRCAVETAEIYQKLI
jgi:glycosyltransferase involved in cell wall biosynthesis